LLKKPLSFPAPRYGNCRTAVTSSDSSEKKHPSVIEVRLFVPRVGQGLIDSVVEIAIRIENLRVMSAIRVCADDKDRGCCVDSHPLAKISVCLHSGLKFALRIEGHWQADPVALRKLLRELVERDDVVDGRLVGKDLIAILIAESFASGVEPARSHRGVAAPVVVGNQEVMTYPRNFVSGGRLLENGIEMSASGAFKIVELDDRNASTSRRLECGRVQHLDGCELAKEGMWDGRRKKEQRKERTASAAETQGESLEAANQRSCHRTIDDDSRRIVTTWAGDAPSG
jgi:hypothetical protein